MANPFPFVAGNVLTAAEMNGIGEATAYTPTFTAIVVGNGTVAFSFVRVQKLVFVRGNLLFGSTTSINGTPTVTFPITAKTISNRTPIGIVCLNDVSASGRFAGNAFFNTTTVFEIRSLTVFSSFIVSSSLGSTNPFTFTTNDSINFEIVYEAA